MYANVTLTPLSELWCYCLLASGLEQGVSDAVCVCVRVIDFELITGCMH